MSDYPIISFLVLPQESDKTITVIPQLNQENKLYLELKTKVKKSMTSGDSSSAHLAKKSMIVPVEPVKVPVKVGSGSKGKKK